MPYILGRLRVSSYPVGPQRQFWAVFGELEAKGVKIRTQIKESAMGADFRKWGRWAGVGLVVVALVIGGIVVMTAQQSGPTPNDSAEVSDENEVVNEGGTNDGGATGETEVAAENEANSATGMPQSGPEDGLLGILLAGAVVYGASLGVSEIYRRVMRVKENA